MYEIMTIGFDGRYFVEKLKNIKRVDHAAGFVAFISFEGECVYAVNADKVVSYKKIDV